MKRRESGNGLHRSGAPAIPGRVARGGESLAASAYAVLKRRIIQCEIAPGSRLTETQLVRELRLGKTPIREALVRLIQEGLVRNIPRHGYEVAPITLSDVEDLFRLRRILEPAAMALAAGHIDGALRHRMERLCRVRSYSPGDARSVAAYRRANHEFHALIARASGSRRLAEAMERVEQESDRLFNLSLLFRDRGEIVRLGHQRLLAALVAGDAEAARRHALEGIVRSERVIKEALLASAAVQATSVTTIPRPQGHRWGSATP